MRPPVILIATLLAAVAATPSRAQQPPPPPIRQPHAPLVRPPHHAAPARTAPGASAHAAPQAPAAVAPTAPGAASADAAPTSPAAAPPDPAKGTDTGLPLPRWAALRTDEVNMRAGPGTRYPIDWVYKRRDLPVQVVREFEKWRLVVDQDDTKGWVHQATLVTRRDFVVTGAERVLREEARDDAAPVARLAVGVVGRIRACAAGAAWCEVQTADYRGWLRRDSFWGTAAGEAVQ